MQPITILTDSAVQFIHPTFPGSELVKIVPLYPAPPSSKDEYRLAASSEQEVQTVLQQTSQNSAYVFAILSSGYLSALPNQVLRLMSATSAAPRLVTIDSLSIGLGTGYLVEMAAGLAVEQRSPSEIEQTIREYCSMLYTAVVLPDLASLVPVGLVDAAQAKVASILGIQSIFSMEDGLPTPLVKVRNRRAAYEYLVEFIDEFEKFHLIAAIQDGSNDQTDLQIITDHLTELYPDNALSIYPANSAWKTVFGQNSYGLVIISNEN